MNEELTLRIIQGDRKHMSVEVIEIGGYQEVGKNMTAVKIGEDVVIFDMGIHLDRISMH